MTDATSLILKNQEVIFNALQRLSERVDQDSINQQLQKILINQHVANRDNNKASHKNIAEAGFRCYSQFEEDGIILYVLSVIGMATRKVVEICCGRGSECMATNLILNHGYQGYLFDGNAKNIEAAQLFFKQKKDSMHTPPLSEMHG